MLLTFDTFSQLGFKFAALAAGPADLKLDWFVRIVRDKWIYLAVAGYLGAFITWMTLLQRAPVGPAFAASHLDIVTVLLLSGLVLDERLSRVQMLGAALILTGIGILASAKSRESG
ncbi:MAG TPA: EamA family transporter [Candidatus Binatia bacterium]|jgi:drug/metabolite transporter (DMT)-like permease